MKNLFPPRRILIPVDFSPPSIRAVQFGIKLGELFGAKLSLLYMEEVFPAPGPESANVLVARQALRRRDPQRLDRARRRLERLVRGYSGPTAARAVLGVVSHALPRLAAKSSDLVVMGTHGYGGLARVVHGSMAETVMRGAGKPVLAVHAGRGEINLKRVLCPYNMRDYSVPALQYAARLALALEAELTVLYVPAQAQRGVQALAGLDSEVRRILGPLAPKLALEVIRGKPADIMAQDAKKGRFDLVVLAEHEGSWQNRLFGTTAERLLRGLATPLLTVPAAENSA